ncbi:MAG: hypothetical protein ACKOYC_05195 [Bacteroidota bacterium]
MEHRLKVIAVAIVILSGFYTHSVAQKNEWRTMSFDSLDFYRLELKDGTEMIGNVVDQDSLNLYLKTKYIPRIEVSYQSISQIEIIPKENIQGGTYWFRNPHTTRYFFAPSAFNLKKGEGYYQNTYLFLNSFNVGVTDHFSIGGGFEIISLFGSMSSGEFSPVFFITPKVSFEAAKNFHYGFGVFYLNVPDLFEEGRSGAGITYAMGTYGSENRNITVGSGLSFTDSGFDSSPIFTLCGLSRFSKRTAFVTENWILYDGPETNGIYSYGFRFFGPKIAVDLGFINNSDISRALFLGIPYVDFTVKF